MNHKTLVSTEETVVTPLPRAEVSPRGLPVRTHLRAGLAWDDLDDKAKEWWNNLSSTVSGAFSGTEEKS